VSRQIIIDHSLINWRAARLVGGRLMAISTAPTALSDTAGKLPPLVGDIYLGRVRRMAPETGGCFVDLGQGEQALLPIEKKSDAVHEGAAVTVQVSRAARGAKGPRVGRHITLAGRFDDYPSLEARAKALAAPCPIWVSPPDRRVLLDVRDGPVDQIICPPELEKPLANLIAELGIETDLVPWREPGSPFEALGVEDQIADALATKVGLPGGGFLLIEPTAALVAIDVNAGSDPRGWSHINSQAASEIVRQIQLRDLGGKIVIDFISGRDSPDLRPLVVEMGKQLVANGTRCRIIGPSTLGLVEIERQRRDRGITGDIRHFADQALRRAGRLALARPDRGIRISAGQAVFDWYHARPALLSALAEQFGRPVQWMLDTQLMPGATQVEDCTP